MTTPKPTSGLSGVRSVQSRAPAVTRGSVLWPDGSVKVTDSGSAPSDKLTGPVRALAVHAPATWAMLYSRTRLVEWDDAQQRYVDVHASGEVAP